MNTDEEALLAAIEETPLDNAPRLIYADWLQERDDESRAEYLRAIVCLIQSPGDSGLIARCAELSETIDYEWRRRVGGRFEILAEGFSTAEMITRVICAAFRFSPRIDNLGNPPIPVRLRCDLTPEGADRMREELEPFANAVQDAIKNEIR